MREIVHPQIQMMKSMDLWIWWCPVSSRVCQVEVITVVTVNPSQNSVAPRIKVGLDLVLVYIDPRVNNTYMYFSKDNDSGIHTSR